MVIDRPLRWRALRTRPWMSWTWPPGTVRKTGDSTSCVHSSSFEKVSPSGTRSGNCWKFRAIYLKPGNILCMLMYSYFKIDEGHILFVSSWLTFLKGVVLCSGRVCKRTFCKLCRSAPYGRTGDRMWSGDLICSRYMFRMFISKWSPTFAKGVCPPTAKMFVPDHG